MLDAREIYPLKNVKAEIGESWCSPMITAIREGARHLLQTRTTLFRLLDN